MFFVRVRGRLPLGVFLLRQLPFVMTLAGAVEDQQSEREGETGFAKEESHNAPHTKRLGSDGARRKANRQAFLGMKLKGLSLALL